MPGLLVEASWSKAGVVACGRPEAQLGLSHPGHLVVIVYSSNCGSNLYWFIKIQKSTFIGSKSDHCLPLSLTHWLSHSCLVDLFDVTLAFEDANSKLIDVVTVADDDLVGNNLLQIWKPRFGQKSKCLFRLWAKSLVKILKLKFRQDLKLEFGQFFLLMFCRGYVESKLNLGWDSEARFGNIFKFNLVEMFMFGWDFEVDTCSRFWRCDMICVRNCNMN